MSVDPIDIAGDLERAGAAGQLTPEEAGEIRAYVEQAQSSAGGAPEHAPPVVEEESGTADIRTLLASMPLPGRMKYALFGSGVCRGILIRDGNKLVQQFVLKNPKITLKEIEEFSRNPHLSDFILRTISDSKMWMKSAIVKYNIVTNPKTPQDVSLRWLRYLPSHEITKISKSKSIPQAVAAAAKKLDE